MRFLIAVLLSGSLIGGCDKFKLEDLKYSGRLINDPSVSANSQKKSNALKPGGGHSSEVSHPNIVIKNSTITINQKVVWMGGDLKQWKSAIGGKPRCIENKASLTVCVWDNFGIEVGTDTDEQDKAKFFNINLALTEAVEGFPKSDYSATHPFRGYLQLDGFSITPATEFRSIRARADAKRDLRCGGRDCSNPTGGFSDGASLYMQLNSQSDHGKLLGFSVSCVSTRDCVELIPK